VVVRLLPSAVRGGITDTGTPDRPATEWKRNPVNPASELPAQTPVPTHRHEPREVRRRGYLRESRSPSRRVVVKLGSRLACADGVSTSVGAPSFSSGRCLPPGPRVRSSRLREPAGDPSTGGAQNRICGRANPGRRRAQVAAGGSPTRPGRPPGPPASGLWGASRCGQFARRIDDGLACLGPNSPDQTMPIGVEG
jgi:hypothetical protein